MEDDDVWGDDHDQHHDLERESNARREIHYNTGYREGLEEGQQQTIQQGFDAGTITQAALCMLLEPTHVASKQCSQFIRPQLTIRFQLLHVLGFAMGTKAGFACGQLRAITQTLQALHGNTTTLPAPVASYGALQDRQQRGRLRQAVCTGLLEEPSSDQVCGDGWRRTQAHGVSTPFVHNAQAVPGTAPGLDLDDILTSAPQPAAVHEARWQGINRDVLQRGGWPALVSE